MGLGSRSLQPVRCCCVRSVLVCMRPQHREKVQSVCVWWCDVPRCVTAGDGFVCFRGKESHFLSPPKHSIWNPASQPRLQSDCVWSGLTGRLDGRLHATDSRLVGGGGSVCWGEFVMLWGWWCVLDVLSKGGMWSSLFPTAIVILLSLNLFVY